MRRGWGIVASVLLALARPAASADDCTTWCIPLFGAGIGVTCQAAVPDTGPCLRRCFFENGWWIDPGAGAVLRSPTPGGGGQVQGTGRPRREPVLAPVGRVCAGRHCRGGRAGAAPWGPSSWPSSCGRADRDEPECCAGDAAADLARRAAAASGRQAERMGARAAPRGAARARRVW